MPVESATYIKQRLGGYLVTRFGSDLMLKEPEAEMSASQVDAEMAFLTMPLLSYPTSSTEPAEVTHAG